MEDRGPRAAPGDKRSIGVFQRSPWAPGLSRVPTTALLQEPASCSQPTSQAVNQRISLLLLKVGRRTQPCCGGRRSPPRPAEVTTEVIWKNVTRLSCLAPCENKNRAVRYLELRDPMKWSKPRDLAGFTAQGVPSDLLFRMEVGPLKHASLAPHGWQVRTCSPFPSQQGHSFPVPDSTRESLPENLPSARSWEKERKRCCPRSLRVVIPRGLQLLEVPDTLSRAFQGQGYFPHSTKMICLFTPILSACIYSHKFFLRMASTTKAWVLWRPSIFVCLFIFNFGGHAHSM